LSKSQEEEDDIDSWFEKWSKRCNSKTLRRSESFEAMDELEDLIGLELRKIQRTYDLKKQQKQQSTKTSLQLNTKKEKRNL